VDANALRIISVCEANWEAHKSNCSGFVKAVAAQLEVTTFAHGDDANVIADKLQAATDWVALTEGDGPAAKGQADAGLLVIAGLKGSDQVIPDADGHVVVVVAGPLDSTHEKYPTAYWGRLNGVGAKAQTINWAWRPGDRDKVGYFAKSLAAVVAGINPTSGPAAGGTTVTITGSGFSGAKQVDFGATEASNVTVDSDTQITAVSPAGTGTVDVTVVKPAGASATSAADQFTYVAGPLASPPEGAGS